MTAQTVLFLIFSGVMLLAALRVITARNPVHAVLFLVLAFFSAACLWMLLQAEFLAIALVLVYVGAVMVLFLFVVMMLDVDLERLRAGFWRNLPVAAVVGGIMAFELVAMLASRHFGAALSTRVVPAGYSNTRELGRVLYTQYVYAFEIAAVILLVAIIAAIALTLRRRKDTKALDPAVQLAVRRNDRVRLVSMPPEKDV
jgi:NADH-quinone oxidoreductase subunit J